MLREDGPHSKNGQGINLTAGAEMSGPVALDDLQQTCHLGKHTLVGHGVWDAVFGSTWEPPSGYF
jgi:hypothetical protein